MKMQTIRMDEMNSPDIKEAIERGFKTVVGKHRHIAISDCFI